jgi:vitamin-K-epoxide reductase (warfarin-sensitive)
MSATPSSPTPTVNPIYNRTIFILALLGAMVAGLLWNWHAHPIDIPCGGTRGCLDVAQSKYASFPIGSDYPVAMYGVFGYVLIIVLAFLRTLPNPPKRDHRLLGLIVAVSTIGTLFALQLTFVEAFVLNAWCKWCVASQILILSIAVVSVTEWRQQRNSSLLNSSTETASL